MNPEETTSSKRKTFFAVVLVAVLILAGVLGYRSYSRNKNAEPPAPLGTAQPREISEAEKLLKAQVDAMDGMRMEYQGTSALQATTTLAEQIKGLDALRAKQQKTASLVPKQTLEQQIQALDTLRSATLNK